MTKITVTFEFDDVEPDVLEEAMENWRACGVMEADVCTAVEGILEERGIVDPEFDRSPGIEIGAASRPRKRK